MREIKFRVWNGIEWCGTIVAGQIVNPCEYGSYEDLVYQQFVGLKDKNNNEIYEGDILIYPHSKAIDPITKDIDYSLEQYFPKLIIKIGTIEKIYENGKIKDDFYCGVYGNYWQTELNIPIKKYMIEAGRIIGNIFETPESVASLKV